MELIHELLCKEISWSKSYKMDSSLGQRFASREGMTLMIGQLVLQILRIKLCVEHYFCIENN
jgi:hypothetical protein